MNSQIRYIFRYIQSSAKPSNHTVQILAGGVSMSIVGNIIIRQLAVNYITDKRVKDRLYDRR